MGEVKTDKSLIDLNHAADSGSSRAGTFTSFCSQLAGQFNGLQLVCNDKLLKTDLFSKYSMEKHTDMDITHAVSLLNTVSLREPYILTYNSPKTGE